MNNSELAPFIIERTPFKGSNFAGKCVDSTYPTEGLSPEESQKFRDSNPSYAVYSYDTPIAWYNSTDEQWYITKDSFSSSTTRHVNIVKSALGLE